MPVSVFLLESDPIVNLACHIILVVTPFVIAIYSFAEKYIPTRPEILRQGASKKTPKISDSMDMLNHW